MRLTLRTLLAWMDGVLPPEAAGQLAEKVGGSAVAQTLANRIRDIVTRPTIAAASPEGRGLAADPNTAAEFLDNALPGGRLTEFERVCIESDMQLAEVADCHRLLADLTAGRVTIGEADAGLVERLQAIVASESAAAVARAVIPMPSAAAVDTEDDVDVVSVSATPAALGRSLMPPTPSSPATRRRAWLLAGSAAAVLVGLLGVLGWSLADRSSRAVAIRGPVPVEPPPAVTSRDGAIDAEVAQAGPPTAPAEQTDGPPVEPADEPRDEPTASPEKPAAGSPLPPSPPPAVAVAAATAAPPGPPRGAAEPQPSPGGQPPPSTAARVPQGEALAIAAPLATPVAAQPQPVVERPVEPAAATERAAAEVAGPFVLLVGAAAAPQQPLVWQARRAPAPVTLPADLVSPAFSQPELVIGRLRMRFLPGTRAVVGTDLDGTVRLEVLFGRAVVVSEDPAARLGVTAAGLVGRVRDGLEAPVGIEVMLDREPGSDPATVPATRRARILSTAGMAWEQTADDGGPAGQPLRGFEPEGRIPGGTVVTWSSTSADTASLTRAVTAPEWLAGNAAIEPADRQAALSLAARLPAAGPAQAALEQLAADPRGEQRVLAAATLALLGDYVETVRQLSAEERGRELYAGQWAKLEALTVPLALARGANAAARLAKAFSDQAPPGTADSLTRLARGFTPAELAAGADAWLVDALDDPHLVVRRYAFQRLTELASPAAVDRLRYRPDGRPEQRRDGVEWWRRQLQEGRLRGPSPAPR